MNCTWYVERSSWLKTHDSTFLIVLTYDQQALLLTQDSVKMCDSRLTTLLRAQFHDQQALLLTQDSFMIQDSRLVSHLS